jgi:hypothetical protein
MLQRFCECDFGNSKAIVEPGKGAFQIVASHDCGPSIHRICEVRRTTDCRSILLGRNVTLKCARYLVQVADQGLDLRHLPACHIHLQLLEPQEPPDQIGDGERMFLACRLASDRHRHACRDVLRMRSILTLSSRMR